MVTRCLNMLCDIDYAFTIFTDFNMQNFNWNENLEFSTLCPLYACLANFLIENDVTK